MDKIKAAFPDARYTSRYNPPLGKQVHRTVVVTSHQLKIMPHRAYNEKQQPQE